MRRYTNGMDVCHINSQSLNLSPFVFEIPGDKSISHRTAILSSLATNQSVFHNFLCSEDCLNTVRILQQLGVPIQLEGTTLSVDGVGRHGLIQSDVPFDVGNSGTGIRLLTGLLSAQSFDSTILGDHSISKRPMKRVVDPLTQMGAQIQGETLEHSQDVFPPLQISGGAYLSGVSYSMPVASAQVKSAILLAGLYTSETVVIQEPEACRDHTERLLRWYGVSVQQRANTIILNGPRRLFNSSTHALMIPSDISSALFYIALSLGKASGKMVFPHIGLNPTRVAVLDVLRDMGADLIIEANQDAFEPLGELSVRPSALKNISISGNIIPNVIDEIPILSVVALMGDGVFSVRDAKELRVKESDRIQGIVALMTAMGIHIQDYEDGFDLQGGQLISDFEYDANGDHRLAMSAIVAALIGGVSATIYGCQSIATSFPNFFDILETLQIQFEWVS